MITFVCDSFRGMFIYFYKGRLLTPTGKLFFKVTLLTAK